MIIMVQTAAETKAKSVARRDLRFLGIIDRLLAGGSIGDDAKWLTGVKSHARRILERYENSTESNRDTTSI